MLATLAMLALSTDDFFQVQTLAKDVYAIVRTEPPGLAVDSNVLVIVNDKDVVLVDANIGPESATATLKAIRKITLKPISAIIATHYHDDHMGGTSVFLKDSPKAELIAHRSSPIAIENLLKPARKDMIHVAPQTTAYLRGLITKGKSMGGWDITPEEVASYQSDIRIADRYAKEMPSIPLPKPTRLIDDKFVLSRGKRRIEILHLGAAHTPSDLVVYLPAEKVAACGDMVVYPVPLVGGPQSSIKNWPGTLEKLIRLNAKKILPGHGPVLRDTRYIYAMKNFFEEAWKVVDAKIKTGEDLAKIQRSADFTATESAFCGTSKVRKVLWDNYVKEPTIAAAYREQTTK